MIVWKGSFSMQRHERCLPVFSPKDPHLSVRWKAACLHLVESRPSSRFSWLPLCAIPSSPPLPPPGLLARMQVAGNLHISIQNSRSRITSLSSPPSILPDQKYAAPRFLHSPAPGDSDTYMREESMIAWLATAAGEIHVAVIEVYRGKSPEDTPAQRP